MSSGETAEIKEGTCGKAKAEKKKMKEGERERGQGGGVLSEAQQI